MKITCSSCGGIFEFTPKLLELFEQASAQRLMPGCPDDDCTKYFSSATVEKVLAAASKVVAPLVVPPTKSLKAIGAEGILTASDLVDLSEGKRRVARLMNDGRWYTSDQIKTAAGTGGVQASEGLRRMRELREIDGVDIRRERIEDSRLWRYRLVRF